jgi:hypothetical protein
VKHARAWNRTQLHYHSNRLEGLALLMGLRYLTRFLTFAKECSFGEPPPRPTVCVLSDSKSAVAWAAGRPPAPRDDSLEYRMLLRLAEGLHEEIVALRGLADVSISHLKGNLNGEADSLSRLLYRECTRKPTLTLASVMRRADVSENAVLHVEQGQTCFVETLALDCYDWLQLLE